MTAEAIQVVGIVFSGGSALVAAIFSVKVWFMLGQHDKGMKDLDRRVTHLERKVYQ